MLAELDLTAMISDVDTLVATGQKGLEQTMAKLNAVDIYTPNQAIKDLAAVIEPLAKISTLFKEAIKITVLLENTTTREALCCEHGLSLFIETGDR